MKENKYTDAYGNIYAYDERHASWQVYSEGTHMIAETGEYEEDIVYVPDEVVRVLVETGTIWRES